MSEQKLTQVRAVRGGRPGAPLREPPQRKSPLLRAFLSGSDGAAHGLFQMLGIETLAEDGAATAYEYRQQQSAQHSVQKRRPSFVRFDVETPCLPPARACCCPAACFAKDSRFGRSGKTMTLSRGIL